MGPHSATTSPAPRTTPLPAALHDWQHRSSVCLQRLAHRGSDAPGEALPWVGQRNGGRQQATLRVLQVFNWHAACAAANRTLKHQGLGLPICLPACRFTRQGGRGVTWQPMPLPQRERRQLCRGLTWAGLSSRSRLSRGQQQALRPSQQWTAPLPVRTTMACRSAPQQPASCGSAPPAAATAAAAQGSWAPQALRSTHPAPTPPALRLRCRRLLSPLPVLAVCRLPHS